MRLPFFRQKNEYEKNSKTYIQNKFRFLIDRGYKMQYYFRNGEEEFCYSDDNLIVTVFNEPGYIDVATYEKASFPFGRSANIRKILPDEIDEDIKTLSPMQKIDYFADLVFKNIETLEKYYNRN